MKPTDLIAVPGRRPQEPSTWRRHDLRRRRGVSWFTVKRGRLEYRGRITRQPFVKWCATKDGREAIARVAKGMRFSIFGRARSAQRRLWRELDAAARTDLFATAVRGMP